MLILAFGGAKWSDCRDELSCLPAFRDSTAHVEGMARTAEAVQAALDG
ncbi:MAG: hypothetical protein AAGG01_05970 [Planctomycetota bacterium]